MPTLEELEATVMAYDRAIERSHLRQIDLLNGTIASERQRTLEYARENGELKRLLAEARRKGGASDA